MPTKDPRVDAYIAKSADFAKPILIHLRKLVHRACPGVEETLKWRTPAFMHKGILCVTAAFKGHCAFILWKRSLIARDYQGGKDKAWGHFGRVTKRSDLPSDELLLGYLRKAVELNESGTRPPAPARTKAKARLIVPDYFKTALKKNKKAQAAFEAFSPSHRKEYVQWIAEAKREETRAKRLNTAIDWLAKGKSRNWKYE